MIKLNGRVTDASDFYGGLDVFALLERFGSPLYVYNERVLRRACRDMKSLTAYPEFRVHYSAKANSNLALLEIVRDEGLDVEAVSPGEIFIELKAGFGSEQIFFVSNNVSAEEMRYAAERGVTQSVDSLSQLEQYGRLFPGGKVVVRFNPGIGAGHHAKVMTAGAHTKFGVNLERAGEVKRLLDKYGLRLIGIHQHIGSLFMDGEKYLASAEKLLDTAKRFEGLEFIDLGGGFGVPYRKQDGERRLELKALGERLTELFENCSRELGRRMAFKIEPGRYIPAESGVLLGTVHAVKYNGETRYAGTDIGFNVLARPVLYDAHHDIEVYRREASPSAGETGAAEKQTVVGNICETGDILAADRELPRIAEGDALGVLDAGAYGYCMSSDYNIRMRPAEVLIREGGRPVLIRERETYEAVLAGMKPLSAE